MFNKSGVLKMRKGQKVFKYILISFLEVMNMDLQLMKVVQGIREMDRGYVLAAFRFSGRGPKSKASYVEVYANESDRRPMDK